MQRNPDRRLPLQRYDRHRDLPRLVPLWPHEIADVSAAGCHRICQLLMSAVRRERQRGVAGHWTYDLQRHAGLVVALRAEHDHARQLSPGVPR